MESKQLVEYVWLGGSGWDFRSKCKVVSSPVQCHTQLPVWNFDGSSTGQAPGHKSEVNLVPVKLVPDPFRGGHHKIVLCETYLPDGTPAASNFRNLASKVFNEQEVQKEEIWFGMEQEYILMKESKDGSCAPIAWSESQSKKPQGPFYCGVGAGRALNREVVEEHLQVCLEAGLDMAGINAEVFPGQWEFQVGICKGIDMCDQLWLARYFLLRVCEKYGMHPSFDPKPCKGDWNGSGCHTNISTKSTRDAQDKIAVIRDLLEKQGKFHKTDLLYYGDKNDERLTGHHETASMNNFTWSVGGRNTSIRIPFSTEKGETGYFEDRRPAANVDPYLACARVADSILLGGKYTVAFEGAFSEFKALNGISDRHLLDGKHEDPSRSVIPDFKTLESIRN